MSEALKLAWELITEIVKNCILWIVKFVDGFLGVFDFAMYISIIKSYWITNESIVGKIFSVFVIFILIAIPVLFLILIIRGIITRIQLRATADDNLTLYREIGRLNKQVMQLIDEKNMILAMKSGFGGQALAYVDGDPSLVALPGGAVAEEEDNLLSADIYDPLAEHSPSAQAGGQGIAVIGQGGIGSGRLSLSADADIGEDAISSAAAAAAVAAAHARTKAEEAERNAANRFPKLHLVDLKYENYDFPELDTSVTLRDFAENYRKFAASQMKLYYTPEIVRRFVAGMAASQLLILEGISGTGKTSLPYSFSRYIDYPATLVSIQPSYRDRTELLGYFNEFSKRFNETEFLRAVYEAGYREDPAFIVLDEMNLARIEYYFAEMLSVLEMPNEDEWVIDLVPTAWPGDPIRMNGGKIKVSPNTWFVGTANNDDSTFTITDKVYDRAIPIEINERADAFTCELQPRCRISHEHLRNMFEAAKDKYPISESTMARMVKMDRYLQDKFRLAFGNRIVKQMYDFIPVYVDCGGTELDGMDYIIARKVLKKFESANIAFVKDDIKELVGYIDKTFGASNMSDSRAYLQRIHNLY